MKIRLSFKTPDVSMYAMEDIEDEDERSKAEDAIRKFVKWDENLTVEIDTETQEAVVLQV